MNDTTIVYTFPKNRREEVRASLGTYKGYALADLRVYVRDELGAARPTPKGVAIRVEDLPLLRAAVDALIAEAAMPEAAAA